MGWGWKRGKNIERRVKRRKTPSVREARTPPPEARGRRKILLAEDGQAVAPDVFLYCEDPTAPKTASRGTRCPACLPILRSWRSRRRHLHATRPPARHLPRKPGGGGRYCLPKTVKPWHPMFFVLRRPDCAEDGESGHPVGIGSSRTTKDPTRIRIRVGAPLKNRPFGRIWLGV